MYTIYWNVIICILKQKFRIDMNLVHNAFINDVTLNKNTIDNYSDILRKIDEMYSKLNFSITIIL
jgi:hypothetical protein